MLTREMQEEILRLKKENDICILAHAYQSHDILEIADHVGDSYGLSLLAAKVPHKTVLMCGVRFMAETVKILSPEKKVLLSHPRYGSFKIHRFQQIFQIIAIFQRFFFLCCVSAKSDYFVKQSKLSVIFAAQLSF